MSDIIQMYPIGRFGNQMFEYAFLKAYSDKYGLELQLPAGWVGYEIFEIRNKPITKQAPVVEHDNFTIGMANVCVKAHFIAKRYTDFLTRNYCKEIFKIRERWHDDTRHNIVAHLRHGDHHKTRVQKTRVFIPIESYKEAFKKYGYNEQDVTWVSEEQPVIKIPEFPFLTDFIRMINAKVLFRANSSFSLWAHVLADDEQKCYSPIITGVGVMNCDFAEGGDQPIVMGGDYFAFAK